MRSRGTTATPPRSMTRQRPAELERGDGGRKRAERHRKRPAAPEHSTFRRVAVFVPLSSYCEPRDT